MAQASPDYVALSDEVARHDCTFGVAVGSKVRGGKGREYRDLDTLVIRSRIRDKPVLASEQIIGGDHNSAATRLLARLRRKGWK